MDDECPDDISHQIFNLAWEYQPVKMFIITYLTFNIVILAMITIILYKVLGK